MWSSGAKCHQYNGYGMILKTSCIAGIMHSWLMSVCWTIQFEFNPVASVAWEDKETLKCGPRANICIIESDVFKHKTETRSLLLSFKFYVSW